MQPRQRGQLRLPRLCLESPRCPPSSSCGPCRQATEPVQRALPFASLTPAQAADLAGKVRLYKVALDSAQGEWGGRVGYDLAHDDEPAVRGSVYLDREADEEATVVYVRGVLQVNRHPRRGSRGQFGGFTEYRLVETLQ